MSTFSVWSFILSSILSETSFQDDEKVCYLFWSCLIILKYFVNYIVVILTRLFGLYLLVFLILNVLSRFSKESISNQTKVKASVQRGILAKIIEQYPSLEVYIEDILPKKAGIVQVKWYAAFLSPTLLNHNSTFMIHLNRIFFNWFTHNISDYVLPVPITLVWSLSTKKSSFSKRETVLSSLLLDYFTNV